MWKNQDDRAISHPIQKESTLLRGPCCRDAQLRASLAHVRPIAEETRKSVVSLSLLIFTFFFVLPAFSPIPATLFHSRNWLRTRWPIKSITARTRIKIAAFVEAR
jgi:hypothetical protein